MPETKTTIDKNAPILMQWIISDPKRLKEQAEEGRHPLPNTKTFPHRQRLIDMATVEPDRLICLYYLGDTLDEKQNKQMEELENLAPNIKAIDFNQLDWSEYDFEFNTSMLSVEDKGEDMKMTEYLKLPNTDNRMGFRLDMMRSLMLLKAEQGVIEARKVKEGDIGKGAIFFDFDIVPKNRMGQLEAPYGILSGYNRSICSHNAFKFFFYSTAAVTESKNYVLTNACENIKNCIIQGEIKKKVFNIGSIRFGFRSHQLCQNALAFCSVANSIADLIVDRASGKTRAKINDTTDGHKKYKLVSKLITKDKIGFAHAVKTNGSSLNYVCVTISCKRFHSWVVSEDADVNKKDRNNSICYKIFKAMYKNTELRVKKPATSVNDVRLEQQNYGCCIS